MVLVIAERPYRGFLSAPFTGTKVRKSSLKRPSRTPERSFRSPKRPFRTTKRPFRSPKRPFRSPKRSFQIPERRFGVRNFGKGMKMDGYENDGKRRTKMTMMTKLEQGFLLEGRSPVRKRYPAAEGTLARRPSDGRNTFKIAALLS